MRRDGSYINEEFVEMSRCIPLVLIMVMPRHGNHPLSMERWNEIRIAKRLDFRHFDIEKKIIDHHIVIVFQQFVCRFDLLHVQEGDSSVSYVCDINGWSFVKSFVDREISSYSTVPVPVPYSYHYNRRVIFLAQPVQMSL